MKKTVLVLDANPAVQAITVAALEPLGVKVRSHGDGSTALEEIQAKRPALIICSDDLKGSQPLELCARVRQDASLGNPAFILLTANAGDKEIKLQAKKAGVNNLLSKPFKSGQLHQLVEQILGTTQSLQQKSGPLTLHLNDLMTKNIIEKIINKHQGVYRFFDSLESLTKASKKSPSSGVIVEFSELKDFRWYNQDSMGTLFVIASEAESSMRDAFPKESQILTRPLSVEKLNQAFRGFLEHYPTEQTLHTGILEQGEQTLLAARISATIFEKLLNQEALRNCKWEEACALIGAEALRMCRTYKL